MPTDTREMIAIHDAFRAEFGALPGMITVVPDGDSGRAEIVGGHVMMMTMMLHSHHSSEDVLLWPVLEQRVPARADFVHTMEAQHQRISELIEAAKAQAGPWMGTGSAAMGADLAATVTELRERMVEHLSIEEAEVLPLVVAHMTQEEFSAIGHHSRDSLTPDQLSVGLGLVLDDTSPELAEVLLSAMPPDARAGFEQFGMPMYTQYRARLTGAA